MADDRQSTDHTILICSKCEGPSAASRLKEAIAGDLPSDYVFRAVNCMAGCDYPTAVGFQADGKAFYLFGNVENADAVAAIQQFAGQYQRSKDGWTSAGERPVALYNKTLARLPSLKQGSRK